MDTTRERIARVLDPEIWQDDTPVPTRSDVENFHRRRQRSISMADAVIAEFILAQADQELLYGTPRSTRRGLL